MRLTLVILSFFAVVLIQDPPGHGPEPAAGWFCSHEATDDHKCECQRTCSKNQVCDDAGNCEPAPGVSIAEDTKCKVFCHKEHCACPVKGCDFTEEH